MSTFNVYIGDNLIMESIPDTDIKHKLEYITEYFNTTLMMNFVKKR